MRLPKKLSIFGQTWQVVEQHKIPSDDDKELAGLACKESKTIHIEKLQDVEAKLHTLIHEVGHAMFARVGLNQTEISSDIEEVIVENFATVMCENFDIKIKLPKRK